MKTHILKTVDPFFSDIKNSGKRFEVRKNDRHFTVGNQVLFVRGTDLFNTNDALCGRINYILTSETLRTLGANLTDDFIIFSFSLAIAGRWE